MDVAVAEMAEGDDAGAGEALLDPRAASTTKAGIAATGTEISCLAAARLLLGFEMLSRSRHSASAWASLAAIVASAAIPSPAPT